MSTRTRTVLILIRETALRHGQFEARLESGRAVVKSSTTPFCDAARVLLGLGYSPDTVLVMRHAGSQTEALRAPIGVAAGLEVAEGYFRPFRALAERVGKPAEEPGPTGDRTEGEAAVRVSAKAQEAPS